MARSTRLISLNLGSQTIGLAEFRVEAHGGLALVDYRFREIPVDPTGERMGRAQMLIALGEMMNELQFQRLEWLFVARGYRSAHDKSSLYRAGQSFLAEHSNWRQFNHRRDCQGIWRAIRSSGIA